MNYKVGDKVRVKSLEWYNENKDEFGDVKTPNNVFVPDMSRFCGQECIICQVLEDASCNKTYYGLKEDVSGFSWTDDMFEGLVESELNKPRDNEQSFKAVDDCDCVKPVIFENIVFPNENNADKVELCLGDDYEIVVEYGRIFVQKKKPKYPTTYEECCDVLKIPKDERYIDIDVPLSYNNPLYKFTELLICRDAYWKIAGEQMGLGKSWKPDWKDCTKPKYTIHLHCDGHVFWQDVSHTEYRWLSFPTAEMRDAFYKNFKGLIKECEELL